MRTELQLHLLTNAAGVVGDEPAGENNAVFGNAHDGFNQCDAVTGCAGSDKSDLAGAEAEFGKGHGCRCNGMGWIAGLRRPAGCCFLLALLTNVQGRHRHTAFGGHVDGFVTLLGALAR